MSSLPTPSPLKRLNPVLEAIMREWPNRSADQELDLVEQRRIQDQTSDVALAAFNREQNQS